MSMRQRRDDGAPEQQRPRDRTGRPLPYDTNATLLAQDHKPASVEEALALGRTLWQENRFFEAHECLEKVWHTAPRHDRNLWQGVIQIAVAQVHHQRANPPGAIQLYRRALANLAEYPNQWRGVDIDGVRTYATAAIAALQAGVPHPAHPPFPDTDTGAWFAYDDTQDSPSATPTTPADTPRWLAEGLRRTPQRKPSR